jgi:uncharacterized protein YfaS (alpha-2-macroglobulin family)
MANGGDISHQPSAISHQPSAISHHALSELPKIVRDGLQRLYSMQHDDGGWGWWASGESDFWMSAYVVYGLAECRAAGFAVNADRLARGVRFLIENLNEPEGRCDTQAYMLYALTEAKRVGLNMEVAPAVQATLETVYRERDELNEYTKALLALTLHNLGDARAQVVVRNLEGFAIETEHGVHWGQRLWGWRWSEDQVETTATVLQALVRLAPEHRFIPKVVQWLVLNRQGNHWKSTRDTATAIYALVEYLAQAEELRPRFTAHVSLNGQRLQSFEVTTDNALTFQGTLTVEPEQLRHGDNVVEIAKDGAGSLYYTLFLKYYSLEEPIPASSNIVSVKRRYYQLIPSTTPPSPPLVKGGVGGVRQYHREPLEGPVASGDEIEVELKITSENEFDYMVFEDFKPAGCEPVDLVSGPSWGQVYAHRELGDEKVAFFISHLPQGETTLTYRLRAESPGDFHILPHQGGSMYVPEVRGSSEEGRLVIAEK